MHKTRSKRGVEGGGPVAAQERGAGGEAERGGVRGGESGGGGLAVHADAESLRELGQRGEQQAAGAGAQVQDLARGRAVGEGLASGLDQGFRIGAGDQRGGGDCEVEAPELTVAQNIGQWLPCRSAGDQAVVAGLVLRRDLVCGSRSNAVGVRPRVWASSRRASSRGESMPAGRSRSAPAAMHWARVGGGAGAAGGEVGGAGVKLAERGMKRRSGETN